MFSIVLPSTLLLKSLKKSFLNEFLTLVLLFESLPDDSPANFKLREVPHGEVLRVLKLLRSDTSTSPDGIPAKFVKTVAAPLLVPSQLLSTTASGSTIFLRRGKMRESVQILKSINRSMRPLSSHFNSPHYQKSLRNLSRCR